MKNNKLIIYKNNIFTKIAEFFKKIFSRKKILQSKNEKISNDIRDSFKNCNVYSKEKCKNCFAKFYCSGGCAANSYNFHGNINDAYDVGCEMQKKRIECAIMIRAAMAED